MEQNTHRIIISGMQIVDANQTVQDHAVVIERGIITAILPKNMIAHHLPAKQYQFPKNAYLMPGFVDLHVHGAGGCDVMDASAESLTLLSQTLAREGVTGFLATTMSASDQQLEAAITNVAQLMLEDNAWLDNQTGNVSHTNNTSVARGAKILGLHLEGPFLAAAKMGAQDSNKLQLPSVGRMSKWLALSNNTIRIVTLAPELPDADDVIQYLHKNNVVIGLGHTNASFEVTQRAIHAGCTHATHLFNAMSGLHQRAPGAVGALLLSRHVNAELIVDGIHLHPAIVELTYRLKGRDSLVLVTDAMRAKCLGDGDYELGGLQVSVKEGSATLADGTLAGSVLTMPQAIKNMLTYSHCLLNDAIAMATYNPLRILGMSAHKGSVNVGKDADLVVLDAGFNVLLTLRAGHVIYNCTESSSTKQALKFMS